MTTPDTPRHDAAFGAAVRARRAEIGITLEQLAEATGISRSALSRIERDELGTSLNYGLAIAQALGCDMSALLHAPSAASVTRAADALRYTDPATGIERTALARPAPGLAWVVYTVPAGASSSVFAPHRVRTRETFHVIDGTVEVHMAQEIVRLRKGDTATLTADVEHRFRNPGRQSARVMLLIATPQA
ncbi:MAG: XRE family transcriptional regulator [Pseudomonadota bacterium]|nr:XRE family transcriptional regulator [Pseudomonadota bacterium]